ncbi:MAG: hypothetical protein PHE88_11690 [Elusimicrobia bacterium]|nr:hypothetical protein [Elusimicrobiota bacterium]
MRIPIASDLKTRTGVPAGKDARLVNSYVETKGDQSVVRKRPIAQGGIAVGTGQAQGGIGFTIGSTPYFIGFWADTMQVYTGSGTSWNSGTNYLTGDHVSVNFEDYWAINDNINSQPPSSNWSRVYRSAIATQLWTLGIIVNPPITKYNPIACNGTIFCYVDVTTGIPYTSTNGITWLSHISDPLLMSGAFHLIWNGTIFCGVFDSGTGQLTSATSTDGITWNVYNDNQGLNDGGDISWNGTVFCKSNSNGGIATSTDGITWINRGVISSAGYATITWNGTVFCMTDGLVTSNKIYTSADGITWSTKTLPASRAWRNVRANGTKIAVFDTSTNVAVSLDNGLTWTAGTIPSSASGDLGVDGGNGIWLYVNGDTVATTNYYISTDGLNWTTMSLPSSQKWAYVKYGVGKGFVIMDKTTHCVFSTTGF